MHSDFVIALRKVTNEKSKFPNAEEILFNLYCKIQKLIRRKALSQPKLLKQFALNSLGEIRIEQKRIRQYAEKAQEQVKVTIARKDSKNRLSDFDSKDLDRWEAELQYFGDVLTNIEDMNATLLEYLAAYYPEDFIKDENVLNALRQYLPIYNLYRKKIENCVLDHSITSKGNKISLKELSLEEQGKEIIGKLNFEKARDIICQGVSIRMPDTLKRVQKLQDLREKDKVKFERFRGLSKEEIANILVQEISEKRDSIVQTYKQVFDRIDKDSVDPAFTKDLTKKAVLENVLMNKQHFVTLRQYPSDWNNIELFADLWAHSLLLNQWQPKSKIASSAKARSFHDLFEDPSLIDASVRILRAVDPPLINDLNKYIGNSKGAFCVWIDELKRAGIVKNLSDRRAYGAALSRHFKGFSINDSMFAKHQTRAAIKYQNSFRQLIARIKLSQS
jgi:hypothetical protein